MDKQELQEALDSMAKVMMEGSALPGTTGTIAKIGSIVFQSAAAIAKAGGDPVAEIQRIHDADSMIRSVHDDWKRALDDKFGSQT